MIDTLEIKTCERLKSTMFNIPSWYGKCMYHDPRIFISWFVVVIAICFLCYAWNNRN